MKNTYLYQGNVVTASTKEAVINKVIAGRPLEERGTDYSDHSFDDKNRAKNYINNIIKSLIPEVNKIRYYGIINSLMIIEVLLDESKLTDNIKKLLEKHGFTINKDEDGFLMNVKSLDESLFNNFIKKIRILRQLAKQLEAYKIIVTYNESAIKKISDKLHDLKNSTKVTASNNYRFIDVTDNMDNSWLLQGQNKNAVEKLFKLESDEVPMHTSFHELIQLNFDGELPEEILELVNDKSQFKILKKSDNKKLREQFEQLEKIFTDKGIDLTGDMGFEFQDSGTAPLYIDHFCITLYEGEKNEKNYRLVCANGKFYLSDYDEDENDSMELTFDEAKKKCSDLANQISKVTSSSKVIAFNKDRLSDKVKEAYDSLNERYTNYHGKLNKKDLSDSIRFYVDNTQKFYNMLRNNRVSSKNIAWSALLDLVKKTLEWYECSKTELSSEQLKNWFAYNGTTYQDALKEAIKNIDNLRKEYIEEGL